MILPKEAYTSPKWFEKEIKKIFNCTWTFAGLIEDLAQPGDYLTVDSGKYNILVVKNENNHLVALHNLCRHKGTQLIRATGKQKKVLTCPYHDWTYSLSGDLLSIPDEKTEFPGIDKKKLCLHQAKVTCWRGMIFVHPNPAAEPLENWFKGIEAHLGPHNPMELIEDTSSRTDQIINANWKVIVENYIDVYHLSHLHAKTLNMYDHKKAEFKFIGPHYVFWEPLSNRYKTHLDELISTPRIEGFTDTTLGAYVPFLFPGLGLAESESDWSVFQVIPLTVNQTRVVTRSKVRPMNTLQQIQFNLRSSQNLEKWFGDGRKYPNDEVRNDPMNSGDFMTEDIFACEQQQKSFESPLFEPGPSAKNGEYSVRRFQEIVQSYLQ